MENKINIAEILRDMPKGTKLYSSLFGKCELVDVSNVDGVDYVRVVCEGQDEGRKLWETFSSDGRYLNWVKDSECMLFPSHKMRDWTKFFKRGDVVIDTVSGTTTVFKDWEDDDCSKFNSTVATHSGHRFGNEEVCLTSCYSKATNKQIKKFITKIEAYYGGKYNPQKLQVEPVKPKCDFKPFDKVLVRNGVKREWHIDLFEIQFTGDNEYNYQCMTGAWKYCIPYEGNEHLLGTNNPE